jgi:hypothetical protein
MPCKKSKRKTRKHRQASYGMNQPMRLIGDATKATVGLGVFAITANTVSTALKK